MLSLKYVVQIQGEMLQGEMGKTKIQDKVHVGNTNLGVVNI